MELPKPLTGSDLIDCARANAKQGIEIAARQSGYGEDLSRFQQELKQACHHIGIEIESLGDLIATDYEEILGRRGIDIAPDSPSSL